MKTYSLQERKKYLNKISEEALASGEALDEIVRNMHVHDEELDDVVARMRRYAGEFFENGHPTFIMDVDDTISSKQLELEKRRDLFMVFKEILNNIKKHAGANHVSIEINIKGKDFLMKVKDDGCGFDIDAFTDRNGIRNIKSRMNKWGGEPI